MHCFLGKFTELFDKQAVYTHDFFIKYAAFTKLVMIGVNIWPLFCFSFLQPSYGLQKPLNLLQKAGGSPLFVSVVFQSTTCLSCVPAHYGSSSCVVYPPPLSLCFF